MTIENFLNQILENPPTKLVVLHKDRLTRFGFHYLEKLLKKLGCEVIVINSEENKQDDIMKDLHCYYYKFLL
jgi:predicted site-specific integrase-resolvase